MRYALLGASILVGSSMIQCKSRSSHQPTSKVQSGQALSEPHLPIELGEHSYTITPGNALTLKNASDQSLVLVSVKAKAVTGPILSEFCVYLDLFKTEQSSPGTGEVGCSVMFPKADQGTYPDLTWAEQPRARGLRIPPQSTLWVHWNNDLTTSHHTFVLDVAKDLENIDSWRLPKVDTIIGCDKGSEMPVEILTNDSGIPLKIFGVTIYANHNTFNSKEPAIKSACLLKLDGEEREIWNSCESGLSMAKRGTYDFANLFLQPGEKLTAKAHHTCVRGAWDWAAYVHVSPSKN